MTPLSPYDPEIETLWRAIDAAGTRSVAVVSSLQGEGTTLIASALARRAGLSDRPALLVELNQTRPGIVQSLGLRAEAGEITELPALGLAILTGISRSEINAWRDPAALAAQVEIWSASYGLVVFDAPPMLDRDEAAIPAAAIASAAEASVLVALAGRTPVAAIRETLARLQAAGAKLLGTVMNDRDNPSLLAELERETFRFARVLPRAMEAFRARLQRSTLLTVGT